MKEKHLLQQPCGAVCASLMPKLPRDRKLSLLDPAGLAGEGKDTCETKARFLIHVLLHPSRRRRINVRNDELHPVLHSMIRRLDFSGKMPHLSESSEGISVLAACALKRKLHILFKSAPQRGCGKSNNFRSNEILTPAGL